MATSSGGFSANPFVSKRLADLQKRAHTPNGYSHVLLDKILENPLLLCHIVGYLPITDLLNLAATSKQNQKLLYHTPSVFRRLDLSTTKSGQLNIARIDQGGETWRNVQLDENVTEDEYVQKTFMKFIGSPR